MRRRLHLAPLSVVVAFSLVVLRAGHGTGQTRPTAESSCVTCHREGEGELLEPVTVWEGDAHRAAGLGCEGCHGGDPIAEDAELAMDPAKGFRAPPGRLGVAEFCARCHSDAEFMKRFNPQARVDQLAEYRTSVHGKRLAQGDSMPATCTDCHGAHGIRRVSSPNAPVFASNVPRTCARCHADSSVMGPYGIATDQYESYRGSMHGAALLERGDVAAPACNDCHGNHGAAPPGVQSVANVCGQCHAREAGLFRESFKSRVFAEGGFAECTACHDQHRILHPTPELFHGGSAPRVSRGTVTATEPFTASLGDMEAGEEATAEWRVALHPNVRPDDPGYQHTLEVTCDGMSPLVLDVAVRPGTQPESSGAGVRKVSAPPLSVDVEIEPLSGGPPESGDALRFGVTVEASGAARGVTIRDRPGSKVQPISGSVCLSCHTEGDECDQKSERMYVALTSMERELRQAGALLHRAEVAGMDVSAPQFDLKSKGTTASVEARALIHAFDPDRLVRKTEDGQNVAASATNLALAALEELQKRRRGLGLSLALVACVLLGLAAKIREVEQNRRKQLDGDSDDSLP